MTSRSVFTVSQVASYLKAALEADPALMDLWISGEVSNHRRYGSGHAYFSLRDASSTIRCVMFRGGRGHEFLENGTQILAHGRISYYTARGDLQFYVDLAKPEGQGALQIAFERLKAKLESEGLFDPGRKREIPRFPQRIAVVTSPSGAVFHDIVNVLTRRYRLAEVVLVPATVQGDTAAPAIAEAITVANAIPNVDTLVVARGGGSLEDLWPFNEEIVARAIFGSRVPVVSAVGHETDFTIADLVADVRAPTPSAAAELVAPDQRDLMAAITDWAARLTSTMQRHLEDRRDGLELAADRLAAGLPDLEAERLKVDNLLRSSRLAVDGFMRLHRAQAEGIISRLEALNPAAILDRGYAIVRTIPEDAVLTKVENVNPGDRVLVTVSDGDIEAETVRVSPHRS